VGNKLWVIVGVLVGIAVGLGKLAYLAGAASSLSGTALKLVGTGGLSLIHAAATHGAPRRVVEGIAAVVAVLVPGATTLLLVVAARVSLVLRSLVAVLVVALGAVSFAYLPRGEALGVLLLTLVVAALALFATGPLIAAPLAGLGALIATVYLPLLISSRRLLPTGPVNELHEALLGSAGAPLWLAVLLLLVALAPVLWAARLVLG